MPDTCSVLGCSNRSNRNSDKRYFRVPKVVSHNGLRVLEYTKKRRDKWLSNLSLCSKGVESPHARVCSDHFVSGAPSRLLDDSNVDWAPTLNLGHEKLRKQSSADISRQERLQDRASKKRRLDCATALLALQRDVKTTPPVKESSSASHEDSGTTTQKEIEHISSKSSQTDLEGAHIEEIEKWNIQLQSDVKQLKTKLENNKLTRACMEQDPSKVKFYTGLPNYAVLIQVLI